MNNRLLHAAARGARIERQNDHGMWEITNVLLVEPVFDETPKRIHPDDEHLAYGPVSTALREHAELGLPVYYCIADWWLDDFREEDEYLCNLKSEELSTFYLLVAEFCADLGL